MPRRVLFTINNPTYEDQTILELATKHEQFRYMIYQGEVGENNTPHFQGYVEITKSQSLSFFKNLLGARAHIEFCRGSSVDNIHYCSKPLINADGSKCSCDHCKTAIRLTEPIIYGTPAKEISGRQYWESVIQMVHEGKSELDIVGEFPQSAAHLRNIREFKQIHDSNQNRNPLITDPAHQMRQMRAIWLYGDSGVGKTRAVYDTFPRYYKVGKKNGFDFYTAESVVMFDDFNPEQFKLETMLDYLDVYPCQLQCRYNNMWAAYNDVFILSTKLPTELYPKESLEDLRQLLRRVHIVEVYMDYKNVPNGRKFRFNKESYATLQEVLQKIPYRL